MKYVFEELLEAITTTNSCEILWDKLVAYTRAAGSCQLLTCFGSDDKSIKFLATTPSWWEGYYHATNAISFDHVAHHALHGSGPLVFGYENDRHNSKLSDKAISLIKMTSAEFKFGSGICMPSYHGNKRIGAINICFKESVSELHDLPTRNPLQLLLACCTAHERLYALAHGDSKAPSLTPRQTECLTWLATGLNPQEIADKIGISYHTVKMHLDTAKERLKATTRIQAVARALTLGLITVE